jgi:urea transport system substrate-binding protein
MAAAGAKRAVSRGLSRPSEPESGELIAFATRENDVADDGNRGHSPFTAAFLQHVAEPGLEVNFLFRRIRSSVLKATGGGQDPAIYASLSDTQLFFVAPAGLPAAGESKAPLSEAAAAWAEVKDSKEIAVFEAFRKQYGRANALYDTLASERIAALKRPQSALAAPVEAKLPGSANSAEKPKPAPGPNLALAKPEPQQMWPEPKHSSPMAGDVIKVGILHSLSGTMASSETTLKDELLMLIAEQNKKGGVLGRKLEAVIFDPASNWPLFAEKARALIGQEKVAVIFGCWTSVSRKSVLPVVKELNSILFYPVPYEGEESERNVFYTGAVPNQQAFPAVDYLMSKDGGEVRRWVLAGTDYVYPRTANKILEAYLLSKGVAKTDILVNYTPFGHSDWQEIVAEIIKFASAGKKTAVVSTINGDANVSFYKELASRGVQPTDIPVVALSVSEEELAGIDTRNLAGHLAAWNYFESINTPANAEFIKRWHVYTGNSKRVTNDPMEGHYIGFQMWVKAVERAGTTDPDRVIAVLPGTEVANLSGGTAVMLPNHHITKPAFVGEIRRDGQFDVVWAAKTPIAAAVWSPYLDGSKDLVADWVEKKCGQWNVKTKKCAMQ